MDSGAIRLSLCLEMGIIGLTKANSYLPRGKLYSVRLRSLLANARCASSPSALKPVMSMEYRDLHISFAM